MSLSYASSRLSIPAGFDDILESLAREVLREQPKDIILFAASYFKKKLAQRAAREQPDAHAHLHTQPVQHIFPKDLPTQEAQSNSPEASLFLDPAPADRLTEPADNPIEPADRLTEPVSDTQAVEFIANTQTAPGSISTSGSDDEIIKLEQPNKDDQDEPNKDDQDETNKADQDEPNKDDQDETNKDDQDETNKAESGMDEEVVEETSSNMDNDSDPDEAASEGRDQDELFTQDTDSQDEKSSDFDHQSVSDPDDTPQAMKEASETQQQQEGAAGSNLSETAAEDKADEQGPSKSDQDGQEEEGSNVIVEDQPPVELDDSNIPENEGEEAAILSQGEQDEDEGSQGNVSADDPDGEEDRERSLEMSSDEQQHTDED